MNRRQRCTFQQMERVLHFVGDFEDIGSRMPPAYATQAGILREAYAAAATALEQQRAGTVAASVTRKQAAIHALQDRLSVMHRCAALFSKAVEGVCYTLPNARGAREQALLDIARASARDLEPYANVFTDMGLGPAPLDDLRAATDTVTQASDDVLVARMLRGQTTLELSNALHVGKRTVIFLDLMVRRACLEISGGGEIKVVADMGGVLAVWESIIGRSGTRKRVARPRKIGGES